jgi:ABC-type glycerol-3-phosphate transport system substrate-binding protein
MRCAYILFLFISAVIFSSCNGDKTVTIWTDRPEFALYGEYFNTAQEQYKVEVRYVEFPALELKNSSVHPDIVAGNWLKNSSTVTYFKTLDRYFQTKGSGKNKLSGDSFYPRLLAMGRVERNQYLLPVSFNAPTIIFSREKGESLSNPFTIGFEEIKTKGKEYNVTNQGAYTRMGFSPLWNEEFLFITAALFNASFREANPLAWDSRALNRALTYIYEWTHEINTGNQAEEDFTFKYFIEPPAKLVQSDRILFTYMESSDLFTLNEDSRNNLDFRWISEQGIIPLTESSIYMGIIKKSKASKAAMAFICWFFLPETQRYLLETSRVNRIDETVFGICGGFSAIREVTEQIFPRFYPSLLGRMPPADYLTPSNILPENWLSIKDRVILPYLNEKARNAPLEEIYPLERRLVDWLRFNH